jgi:hypothetical protein
MNPTTISKIMKKNIGVNSTEIVVTSIGLKVTIPPHFTKLAAVWYGKKLNISKKFEELLGNSKLLNTKTADKI